MNNRVRVLFINQTYLPDPVATSPYLGSWAEHLAREGHEVTVLAGRRAYHDPGVKHPAREIRARVNVVRLGGGGGRTRGERLLGFVTFLLAVLIRGLLLPQPDVIVALTSPPLLPSVAAVLARLRGARLVVWAMDLHPDAAIAAGLLDGKSVLARVSRLLAGAGLRGADRIITLDEYMRGRLIVQGVDAARVEVISLWTQADIAFDATGREEMRQRHGWKQKFVVMCAGNHGACHSMETMLAAARALRDEPLIHFCWVGGGAQWPALREQAARNISLIGYVPRTRLASLLSAADLQVVVMDEAFVGLLHPCKIYNLLAVRRPLLYLGPEEGPVPDVIVAAGLEHDAASVRPGDVAGLIHAIRARARVLPGGPISIAPDAPGRESRSLEEMTSALGYVADSPVRPWYVTSC